jgi:hypothetical protein
MTLGTEPFGDPAFDTVMVGSITGMEMPSSDSTPVAFVKQAAKAHETDFSDHERMRRAFLRSFGAPPEVLRRTSRRDEIRAIQCRAPRRSRSRLFRA